MNDMVAITLQTTAGDIYNYKYKHSLICFIPLESYYITKHTFLISNWIGNYDDINIYIYI